MPNTKRVHVGTSGGIFKAINGGTTWKAINTGLSIGYLSALSIHPVIPTTVYAGAHGGEVFNSTTAGETWMTLGVFALGARSDMRLDTLLDRTGADTLTDYLRPANEPDWELRLHVPNFCRVNRTPYCDLHPHYPLQACVIETLSPVGDRNKLECFHCTRSTCDHHYHPHFGYFNALHGQQLDLGDAAAKPRCCNHDVMLVMYVQKTDTGWRYACPDPTCTNALPLSDPTPDVNNPIS